MISVVLTAEGRKALRGVAYRFGREQLYAIADKAFDRGAKRAASDIARTKLRGQVLKARTGVLRASVMGVAKRTHGVPGAEIGIFQGAALKYAGIQHDGGTIFPRQKKALAIPVDGGRAVTKAGVARYRSVAEYSEQQKAKLVFVRVQRGRLIGLLYDERDLTPTKRKAGPVDLATITPVFRVVRSARIKGKFFIRDGVRENLPALATAITDDLVKFLTSEAGDA